MADGEREVAFSFLRHPISQYGSQNGGLHVEDWWNPSPRNPVSIVNV